MEAIYRIYKMYTNRKTFETKVEEAGTTKRFTPKANWQITEKMTKGLADNYEYEIDDKGVKVATHTDFLGTHYKYVRERFVDEASNTYDVKDKVSYFKKRVNDKSLTDGQREYAKNRLMALRKIY
jgi:hypothetical protein